MKKTILLFTAMLVLVFGLNFDSAVAGTEHTAYGKVFNSDNSVPGNSDITFVAFIKSRPSEVQTESSTGSGYENGYWNVSCGDFPTAWEVGDVLQVDVTNTTNGETGTVEVTLTSEGNDMAEDLYLEFVVPVELASFNVVAVDGKVDLNWSTKTESNNFGFEIHRKSEKSEYSKIGFVPGNGTTTIPQDYSYTDDSVTSGNYYYRLKQIDHDGSFEYSGEQMVTLSTPSEFKLEKNYPNPFNPETTITYQIGHNPAGASDVKLNIYNSLGELVRTLVDGKQSAGHYSVTWDGRDYHGNFVGTGIYFGRLVTKNQISTIKMMYMK